MTQTVSFDIEGVDAANRRLGAMSLAVQDLRHAWGDVAKEFYQAQASVFGAEGAWHHERWTPLKPKYLAWKVRHGYSSRILVMTGKMRSSLTVGGSPGAVFQQSAQQMTIGTNVKYAKYHQSKDPRKRSKSGNVILPRREFIYKYPGQEESYAAIIRKSILAKFGQL